MLGTTMKYWISCIGQTPSVAKCWVLPGLQQCTQLQLLIRQHRLPQLYWKTYPEVDFWSSRLQHRNTQHRREQYCVCPRSWVLRYLMIRLTADWPFGESVDSGLCMDYWTSHLCFDLKKWLYSIYSTTGISSLVSVIIRWSCIVICRGEPKRGPCKPPLHHY